MFALLVWLACSAEPPVPVDLPAPVVEDAAPVQKVARIKGSPILPKPVVLGAIDAKAVDEGIATQLDAIHRCWDEAPDRKDGKVLVKFIIAKDGTVADATTKSTSLRNTTIEECVNKRVSEAHFPPLQSGNTAIVSYPFAFPR